LGLTVSAVLLATLLMYLLPLGGSLAFGTFLAAVAVSIWYGGLRWGLLAAVLSAAMLDQVVPARLPAGRIDIAEAAALATFGFIAMLVGWLCGARLQAERSKVEDQAHKRRELVSSQVVNRPGSH
jgi:hypothetical protein